MQYLYSTDGKHHRCWDQSCWGAMLRDLVALAESSACRCWWKGTSYCKNMFALQADKGKLVDSAALHDYNDHHHHYSRQSASTMFLRSQILVTETCVRTLPIGPQLTVIVAGKISSLTAQLCRPTTTACCCMWIILSSQDLNTECQ